MAHFNIGINIAFVIAPCIKRIMLCSKYVVCFSWRPVFYGAMKMVVTIKKATPNPSEIATIVELESDGNIVVKPCPVLGTNARVFI